VCPEGQSSPPPQATFDDGPGKGTIKLADFLESKNMSQHATHFMIGGAIVALPDQVKYVFDRGGQIASHTWSHKRMTTLTNEQIVSELGWTMQAIMDHTGGRLPGYWRPPYGDIDNRVRDVAEKVFDLTAVMWNADSSDWKIAREGKAPVEKVFDDWATGPKSPGLNTLMHEINPDTVDIFISRYDNFTANGWKIMNVAEAFNQDMYVNAADNTATVTDMSIAQIGVNVENKISATTTGGVATISAHTTVDSGPVTAATDVPPLTPTGSATTATTTGSGSSGSSGASSSPSSSSGENKSSAARSLLAPLATVIVVAFGAALF
jgi:hypothetical protein